MATIKRGRFPTVTSFGRFVTHPGQKCRVFCCSATPALPFCDYPVLAFCKYLSMLQITLLSRGLCDGVRWFPRWKCERYNIVATMPLPGSQGFLTLEVHHEKQATLPQSILVSRLPASVRRVSLPKPRSSAGTEWFMETRNCSKSSVAMIHARADPAVGFKNCCMLTGEHDGVDRNDFF